MTIQWKLAVALVLVKVLLAAAQCWNLFMDDCHGLVELLFVQKSFDVIRAGIPAM